MTRFSITLEEGVNLVLFAIDKCWGGELYVPKIPSYKILDLSRAIAPECKTEIVGVRPGEKIDEEMITADDSMRSFDCGSYYVINPTVPIWNENDWVEQFKAKKVPMGFKYNSGTNTEWLSIEQIRKLVKEQVDPQFQVTL